MSSSGRVVRLELFSLREFNDFAVYMALGRADGLLFVVM